MCGIMGWAGRSPKSFNSDKFNNLGIQNETRGTHSCGVSVDGEIYFGVDDRKRFRDFLSKGGYPKPTKIPIVVGHTRHATNGSHTMSNAHPFGFGDADKHKDMYAFIGVHNGTLYNSLSLANHFKIDSTSQEVGSNNNSFTRTKIDSEILLEIIFTSKDWKVLSQYNGAAALMFYNVNEPDTVYLFHGATKKELNGNDKNVYVERPLFVWQEHKNSLYISSQKEGLISIGGTEEAITDLTTNVVYKIKNGNLASASTYRISRNSQQQDREFFTAAATKNKKAKQTAIDLNADKSLINGYYDKGRGGTSPFGFNFHGSSVVGKTNNAANIYNDSEMAPFSKKINVQKLRYRRNGHNADGIYVWVDTFGFYFVGTTVINALSTFKRLVNKQFYKGDFVYNKVVLKGAKEQDITIPFPMKEGVKDLPNNAFIEYFHYFFDGVKIISYVDWQAANDFKEKKYTFSIPALSNISCHPIVDITKKKADNDKQNIFFKGSLANSEGFTPLGSSKTYKLVKGNCVEITLVDGAAHRTPFNNLNKLDEAFDKHEATCEVIQLPQNASKNPELDQVEEEVFHKLLDDILCPILDKFYQSRERLQKYSNTELGKDALNLLQDFIKGASQIVAEELNEEH
jgi:hypothetical protein